MNKSFLLTGLFLLAVISLFFLLTNNFINLQQLIYLLFFALSIWGLAILYVANRRNTLKTQRVWKKVLFYVLLSIGFIIMLAGLFLQIPYPNTFNVAMIFWAFGILVGSFLHVEYKPGILSKSRIPPVSANLNEDYL